jgi:hypothetical protein
MRAREKKRISGRKRTIRIAYVAIALCAIIAVVALGRVRDPNGWIRLQTEAIIAAGCIYLWYTVETWQLRLTAEEQITIARAQLRALFRPLVVAEPNRKAFTLRNIGVGPAINISVRPLRYATDAEFRIDKPRMPLRPNESVLLGVRAFVGGKQNGAQIDWRTFFEPGQIARPHTIVIDYESIDGIACSTEMEMLNEGYRIGPIIVDTME